MQNTLKIALIISILLNTGFLLTNYYSKTYDAGTHLFFADHYQRSWFNTWEPRWYTGFTVTSYPPLPHQFVALFSFILGLEHAFLFSVFILMIFFPLAIYEFSKIFVDKEAAGYASLISCFLPSIIQVTYGFGQYPMLFGIVTGLFATSFFYEYLKSGSKFKLVQTAFLIGIVACAHVLSVFFMILLFFVVFLKDLLKNEANKFIVIKRSFLAVTFGIAFSAIALIPFILFVLNNAPQTPIPHYSKANMFVEILNGRYDHLKVLGKLYGFTPILLPFLIPLIYRRKNLILLFLTGSFLFILSLGGTTPLPSLVFGKFWESIGYGRFALLASICFLPLLGILFITLKIKKTPKKVLSLFFLIFIVSTIITTFYIVISYRKLTHTEPIAEFLYNENGTNWYYITLGFGRYSLANLSITDSFRTLDGFYNQGRTLPILRDSGVGFIDGAKYFENGSTLLTEILEKSRDYNLKWVFCNDPKYESILNMSSFTRIEEEYYSITIWEDEIAPPIDECVDENHKTTLFDYTWGILPLLYLNIFLLSLIKSQKETFKSIHKRIFGYMSKARARAELVITK
jgi:hypothetical protein